MQQSTTKDAKSVATRRAYRKLGEWVRNYRERYLLEHKGEKVEVVVEFQVSDLFNVTHPYYTVKSFRLVTPYPVLESKVRSWVKKFGKYLIETDT